MRWPSPGLLSSPSAVLWLSCSTSDVAAARSLYWMRRDRSSAKLPHDCMMSEPHCGARSKLGFYVESLIIAALVLGFLAIFVAGMVHAKPSRGLRVIDGDTIAVRGSRQLVRLVGFNAPET